MTARMHEPGAHVGTEGAAIGSEAGDAEHEDSLDWREIGRIGFVATAAGAFWFMGVESIQSLKSIGLRTVLLTGDAKAVAEDVGKKLGVDEVASELLPEEMLPYVKRLAAASHTVAMVGDGVNDAPALAQATVRRLRRGLNLLRANRLETAVYDVKQRSALPAELVPFKSLFLATN